MGWFEAVREHAIDIDFWRIYIREHASYYVLYLVSLCEVLSHLTSHCFTTQFRGR